MARTDNDTWDLASSVGATATAVAASRAVASKGPDPLINDPFAEGLVRAVGLDVYTRIVNDEFTFTEDDPMFSQQRMAEGMAVRTRYFDDFLTAAADAGLRQAVILASGLDTRAYRLPWPAGTVVFEVDQPQVIDFKTRTLADLGATPRCARRAVGIDLREDWPTALRGSGFDISQPTAWIAEGLLVYLPPDAQDRLFDNITDLSAAGSRLATEHIPDMSVFSDERAKALAERRRRAGFDLDVAALIYHGERSHLIDYLAANDWRVTERAMRQMYAANGFEFPDDEMMAPFADASYISAILKPQDA
jgi:methyltransferase (TIGR00027 family)